MNLKGKKELVKDPKETKKLAQDQINYIYLGSYALKEDKPLWWQLKQKIKGLGVLNIFHLLHTIGVDVKNIRSITHQKLTNSQKVQLEKLILKGVISTTSHYANVKDLKVSSNYSQELFYDTKDQANNLIVIGNLLNSQTQISKKRLIKLKCYIGNRLKERRKVHGQRTKATGRHTKMMKGFQKKNKLNKKERAKES